MSWEMVELREVCEVVSGATPKREVAAYWNGDIDWVTPKDLTDLEGKYIDEAPEKITEEGYNSCSTHLLPPGTVLLSSRAPIGHLAITKRPVCTNQGFKNFVPGPQVDAEYLYWALKRDVPKLQAMGTGSTFKEISKAQVEKYKIPLPPLPTQRRIAAVLDKAQALVANDRQTLALYDQLAKSLFLELFGDPVKNERGWEVVTMGQVMRTKTQNGLYVPKERYTEDGVQMVHMSDAFQGIVQPGRLKRVSISDADQAKYLLEPDDLLVARRSLNYEGSVKPCRIPSSTEPLVYESSLIRLRFNRAVVHPIFVHYYLNDDGARRHHVFKHVTSSTISGINNTGLNAIRMYLPPVHLQDRFNKLVKKIELDKVSTEASLRRSEGLFGSLLQGAFNGELGA